MFYQSYTEFFVAKNEFHDNSKMNSIFSQLHCVMPIIFRRGISLFNGPFSFYFIEWYDRKLGSGHDLGQIRTRVPVIQQLIIVTSEPFVKSPNQFKHL